MPRLSTRLSLVAGAMLALVGPAWGSLVVDAQSQDPATTQKCGLPQAAFCDTFDAPSENNGTRGGDLDGVVWGVSRATSFDNPMQGALYTWLATKRSTCGTQTVGPERDVVICNGQLVESVTDGGAVTTLAMYPKQPFDFTGRIGKVVFDVSGVTQGPHAAWPAFVISDQPVPAPAGLGGPSPMDVPRNSFGLTFAGVCSLNGGSHNGITVDRMWTTTNYQPHAQTPVTTGCVAQPRTETSLNHVEVNISSTSVEVWASDPGGSGLRQIATGAFSMPLTRGLIWIEDQHYNASKDGGTQQTQTYVWDNVGFDGPVLPRDLGFDVLDATHSGTSGGNLGYQVSQSKPSTFSITDVQKVENATGALFMFTFWPHNRDDWIYSVNGHPAHQFPWPFGPNGNTYTSQTLALQVPLNELQNGTNTFTISSTESVVSVANLDLILVGAGGGGSLPQAIPIDPPTPTPVAPADMAPTAAPADTAPAGDMSPPDEMAPADDQPPRDMPSTDEGG